MEKSGNVFIGRGGSGPKIPCLLSFNSFNELLKMLVKMNRNRREHIYSMLYLNTASLYF